MHKGRGEGSCQSQNTQLSADCPRGATAVELVAKHGGFCSADFKDGMLDGGHFSVSSDFQLSGEIFYFFLTFKLYNV